jgi:regulatory protein
VAWIFGRGLLISYLLDLGKGVRQNIYSVTMAKKITALKVQKKNPQRLNVYLDEDFAFGLSRYVAGWLQVGQELSDQKISDLLIEDKKEIAYQIAVKYIAYRPRSISEVKRHLYKKEIDEEIIDNVIDQLNQKGLLNDASLAAVWIENRNEFRPRSHRLLASELRKKGIDTEIIQEALENTTPDEDLAHLAARKQARKYERYEWELFKQKLGAYLARRGFSYGTIKPVIEQIWEENHQENYTANGSEME